jgi:hypothetical protein
MDVNGVDYVRSRELLKKNKRLGKFLKSMPEDVQHSFTEEQLKNLQIALRSPSWKKHPIDFRRSIAFFSYHYYYVFIAGRDNRELTRQEIHIKRWSYLIFITLFLSFSSLLGLLVLYLIKSAMGIDLFPNFSLGIWSWFNTKFLQS